MSEEQDSRTATVGRKRAFNSTTSYDLVTSSDSSDGEPVQKRMKQTSKAVPESTSQRTSQPSTNNGGQQEYISLLSDDSEDYTSAESGDLSEDEADDHPTASAEAGSVGEDVLAARDITDTAVTIPSRSDEDDYVSSRSGGSSLDDQLVFYPKGKDATGADNRCRINFSKFPDDTNRKDVLALFKDYDVQHVSVYPEPAKRGLKSSSNGGCGYVWLPSLAEAERAIATLQGTDIRGSRGNLHIQEASRRAANVTQNGSTEDHTAQTSRAEVGADVPSCRINISRLPNDVTQDDVLTLFKDYEIHNVVFRPQKPSEKRRYGYLSFQPTADAEKAVAALKGTAIRGCVVRLNIHKKENLPVQSQQAELGADVPNRRIHVKLPQNATMGDVESFFQDYKVDSVTFHHQSHGRRLPPKDGGLYSIVCLHSADDIEKAIAALNGKEFLGSKVALQIDSKTQAHHTKTLVPTEHHRGQLDAMDDDSKTEVKAAKRPKKGLREKYGDEYPDALAKAVAEQSLYPIPMSRERRLLHDIGGPHDIYLPDMLENDVPLPFSKLSMITFIPLLLGENRQHACLFVQKPTLVSEAFDRCVNIQYRHINKHMKGALLSNRSRDKHELSAQVADGIASLMPNALKNLVAQGLNNTTPFGKIIHSALEKLASTATDELAESKPVLNTDVSVPSEEPVTVADIKAENEMGSDAKQMMEDSAAAPSIRYVSDLKESSVVKQHSALDHDMFLQEEEEEGEPGKDAEDDELQMRYFPPSEHSTSGPRCLTCGETGHRTSECAPVTCDTCGQIEMHFTWACPSKVRCQRCRELGHRTSECPEKLKRSSGEAVKCELCNSLDHDEYACSRLWRSYEPPAITRKVAGLRVNCFSCGEGEHFGIDCRTRKYLPPASSSFSLKDAQQYMDPSSKDRALDAGKDYSIKKSKKKKPKEFSIKGRATNDIIDLVSDSDEGDFLRPPAKKSRPVQGHIQINSQNSSLGRHETSRDPIPQAYQPQYARGRESPPPVYRDFRDDREGGYRGDYHSRGVTDHYDPQPRYYSGQSSADYYDNRFTAPYGGDPRDGGNGYGGGSDPRGPPRGGYAIRGGNAPRGGKAPRGGNSSRGGAGGGGGARKRQKRGSRG